MNPFENLLFWHFFFAGIFRPLQTTSDHFRPLQTTSINHFKPLQVPNAASTNHFKPLQTTSNEVLGVIKGSIIIYLTVCLCKEKLIGPVEAREDGILWRKSFFLSHKHGHIAFFLGSVFYLACHLYSHVSLLLVVVLASALLAVTLVRTACRSGLQTDQVSAFLLRHGGIVVHDYVDHFIG